MNHPGRKVRMPSQKNRSQYGAGKSQNPRLPIFLNYYHLKEIKMNGLMQMANGFLIGIGLILASTVMRVLFHMNFCG